MSYMKRCCLFNMENKIKKKSEGALTPLIIRTSLVYSKAQRAAEERKATPYQGFYYFALAEAKPLQRCLLDPLQC